MQSYPIQRGLTTRLFLMKLVPTYLLHHTCAKVLALAVVFLFSKSQCSMVTPTVFSSQSHDRTIPSFPTLTCPSGKPSHPSQILKMNYCHQNRWYMFVKCDMKARKCDKITGQWLCQFCLPSLNIQVVSANLEGLFTLISCVTMSVKKKEIHTKLGKFTTLVILSIAWTKRDQIQ